MSERQSSHDDGPRKRKRKRPTLSCTECKRRKIKCDHALPCGPCVSRNATSQCIFEDGSVHQEQQQYVTLSEFQDLQDRFERLEAAFAAKYSDYSLKGAPPTEPDVLDIERAAVALQEVVLGKPILMPKASSTASPAASFSVERDAARSNEPFITSINNTSPCMGQYEQIKHDKCMREVLSSLPDVAVISFLVERYFSNPFQLLWHSLHEPSFRTELAQFNWVAQHGTLMNVDPAWLALLAIVLCVSATDTLEEKSSALDLRGVGLTVESLETLPDVQFNAFEVALRCACWLARPQIRVLSAILVFLPFIRDVDPSRSRVLGDHGIWLDIAIGIAKVLGLHRLTTNPEHMPPDDCAFPAGPSSLKRQIACRIFNTLLFHDTFPAPNVSLDRGTLVTYAFPEGTYDTELRQNYADEDLGPRVHITPRPLHERTQETIEIHKSRIAAHQRRINELIRKPELFTYEVLLECDRELRENHQDLLLTKVGETEICDWAFAMGNNGYQHQLLRLHRPFLTRSYRDSRYLYSQVTALSSARQIMHGHKRLYQSAAKRVWYLYRQHLSAITVRFIHALHTPEKVAECKQELAESLALFRDAAQSEHSAVRRAAGKGDRVIAAMLQMLELPRSPDKNVSAVLDEVVKAAAAPGPPATDHGSGVFTGSSVQPSPPLVEVWMNDDTERLLKALETLPAAAVEPSQPESAFPSAINWQELGIDWSHFVDLPSGAVL